LRGYAGGMAERSGAHRVHTAASQRPAEGPPGDLVIVQRSCPNSRREARGEPGHCNREHHWIAISGQFLSGLYNKPAQVTRRSAYSRSSEPLTRIRLLVGARYSLRAGYEHPTHQMPTQSTPMKPLAVQIRTSTRCDWASWPLGVLALLSPSSVVLYTTALALRSPCGIATDRENRQRRTRDSRGRLPGLGKALRLCWTIQCLFFLFFFNNARWDGSEFARSHRSVSGERSP